MSLQPGQHLTLQIEDLVPGGEGLARHEGLTVFVPDALPGDQLEVRLISIKKTYARALIHRVLQPGPKRVKPPCALAYRCGGCQWQHFAYAGQLQAKQAALLEVMQRIGGWPEALLAASCAPVLGMAEPVAYRNKAQFPVQIVQGRPTLGFYAPRSHQLVPVDHCLIQPEAINTVLGSVQQWLLQHPEISVYEEASHSGLLRHLLIRHSSGTGQTLVGLVVRQPAAAQLLPLAESLRTRHPEIVGVLQNIQPARGNRILGSESEVLSGSQTYLEQLGPLHFELALPAFFQVNPQQTVLLYDQVLAALQPVSGLKVLDAYSGAGSISLWLARAGAQVLGLEIVPEATLNARANARRNGLAPQCRFETGRVEELLAGHLGRETFNAVVLDPPRKGCEPAVLTALAQSNIPQLVYVSCNPATLARDSALLRAAGFDLRALQPVDMFPHTHHLETVAHFVRDSAA
ncbi:MAG: 23S rRNA (uracil(1939)-C(5))-methyltransferase RlmD [Candidatus Sericytochromatia bacterium]|nr:23S rRNA (uracil(1939)-C(5))-methyltransferase RlmD [Candidatus Sericytochromatia bacterium]